MLFRSLACLSDPQIEIACLYQPLAVALVSTVLEIDCVKFFHIYSFGEQTEGQGSGRGGTPRLEILATPSSWHQVPALVPTPRLCVCQTTLTSALHHRNLIISICHFLSDSAPDLYTRERELRQTQTQVPRTRSPHTTHCVSSSRNTGAAQTHGL